MAITLIEALQRAAEAERGGSRFYRMLADKVSDKEARALFSTLSDEETSHAEALDKQVQLISTERGERLPDPAMRALEAASALEHDPSITLQQSFLLALRAEKNAVLFYDAFAGMTQGRVQEFFVRLARWEETHVERLQQWHEELIGPLEEEGEADPSRRDTGDHLTVE